VIAMAELRDSMSDAQGPIAFLRSPSTIRARAHEVLELGLAGKLDHFEVRMDALPRVVDRTLAVTRAAYPTLQIPYHSRWNHFRAGGVDRVADFEKRIAHLPIDERARARFALAITSVLLDAGAGPEWKYREPGTGQVFARSEGLAVASYHMFTSGLFSSDPKSPYRADADGLERLDGLKLGGAFQASSTNPIVGLEGRADLLGRLGSAMRATPRFFGNEGVPRLGRLFDACLSRVEDGRLPARRILFVVLEGLGPIWPGRIELLGVNLGDVWRHSKVGGPTITTGLVPFHKLSQWLTYSLIEPLEWAGIEVARTDELTGLAEYRNGGLFVDDGVLVPKYADVCGKPHAPGDEVIVEWRALTVALLDEVGKAVRERLGKTPEELPLAKVLEGGTWAAGRQAAKEKRPDATPPITVESDGTVF
jgi:hypothetical protein